jgi:hypothetical protein
MKSGIIEPTIIPKIMQLHFRQTMFIGDQTLLFNIPI